MSDYTILPTEATDAPTIYWLFDEAIAYQQRHGYQVWKGYDKEVLRREQEQGLQHKVVIDGQVAAVFSLCYADPLIWGEQERGDALYLHRIVVNPHFKGQKQFEKIAHWAAGHALQRGLRFVRMDTWADNPNLLAYYQAFGFVSLGNSTIPDSPDLPTAYRLLDVVLLEMPLPQP